MSANDNKRIQSIDSIETNKFGTRKNLMCKKEETICNNIIQQNAKVDKLWYFKRKHKRT